MTLFSQQPQKQRLDKNSISGENGVNLPTIKRIVSSFCTPDIMRFSDFKDFSLRSDISRIK
ncbi:TPA: hypothetical protein ACKC0N_000985 [Streptococcus pneumoniae]|uniref:hypothetical protein n=1 Tax=Streptococcus pneumoniae TaxID=1313 RepID=UPI0015C558E9|nr:hypothetical protein [Streptococcus pneumoniae]MDG7997950.1 hypothetical protein [Streptococcus pneumoniae]MDG8616507.1 hypothetical protein [Streptococcus pneumoniae]MDV8594729.1 hypothetical protein [Streptococcus pneumoniae]ULE52707.1 hypothetical protein L1A16_10230 [Streptococcus pneumoniae]HET3294294.1 hypothetical protein [Streptococcus pneumoniae]